MKNSITIQSSKKIEKRFSILTAMVNKITMFCSAWVGEMVSIHEIMGVTAICLALILFIVNNFVCCIFAILFLVLGSVQLMADK
ncbi:MAG: hypothetical protein IJR02_08730 [Bacteroidaceae bacterium]|nr:hypothetical protein [Bacteroidaceae bacterium]